MKKFRNTISLLITPFILMTIVSSLYPSAYSDVKEGRDKFIETNYEEALGKFRNAELENPQSPEILHNIGVSLYKQKRYDKAREQLIKALTHAEDTLLQSKIYYGLGNCYFKEDSLTKSILMYKKALEFNPNDQDAKYNLELARALLKELADKKQQPNQQQQQQQDGQGDQQQQQQNQQQQQQSQGGNKDEEQEGQQEGDKEGDKKEEEKEENEQAGAKDDEKKDEEQEGQSAAQAQKGEKDDDNSMAKEKARRILKALESEEEELQKDRLKGQGTSGKHDKDW